MKKLNIFVLEDNFFHQGRIENAIKLALKKNNLKYRTLEIFGKPKDLINAIEEKGSHQIFFFDIEIKDEEKKGLEIARQVRQLDKHAVIVFVTTHSEFTPLAFRYQVSAFDYINKELDDDDFNERVEEVLTYTAQSLGTTVSDDVFSISNQRSQFEIPFNEILYFETSLSSHKISMVTKTSVTEFYGNLSEVLKANTKLFKAHRSIVVNPYNIREVDKKEGLIKFSDGESCLVARRSVKKLLEILEEIER